ncbi:MAG: VRR-NUC domain-containing protein [Muribaculaceae bacterium]|nr:VRR-NUC domain-containing protein [Muribaculaceae bacterium]
MRDIEHQLQVACVRWFNYQYPRLRGCLVATPNAGRRSIVTGARFKAEGLTAGVADLSLYYKGKTLFIEMKTPKGRQSPSQKEWQQTIEAQGFRYVICRSFEDFTKLINEYIVDT